LPSLLISILRAVSTPEKILFTFSVVLVDIVFAKLERRH